MTNDLLIFEDGEIKTVLSEFMEAGIEIVKREPVVGFHHQFYLPGWIGFVQQLMVEKKMNEWKNKNYYKNKNYTEFAMWLIDSSEKIAEIHIANRPDPSNDEANALFEKQSDVIINITSTLIEIWRASSPEVSTVFSIKLDDETRMSLYGALCNDVSLNLKDIGYPQIPREPLQKGCLEEMKDYFYMIAGWFINITTLGLIVCTVLSIFD